MLPIYAKKVEWSVQITYPDTDGDGLSDTPEGAGTNFNVDTGLQVTITYHEMKMALCTTLLHHTRKMRMVIKLR